METIATIPIATSVDITVYQYGKMFYFFYNIAQRNIKKEIFHIDIELSTQLLANQRSEFTNDILYIV